MRLLHEIAIFQTVKSKVIISLFETVRLSVLISLRNLYSSSNSIKETPVICLMYFSDASFHEVYDELPQDTESEVSVKQWAGVNSIGHHPQNHTSSNNIPPGGKLPIYVYRE